ncbi:acyl transferase domain-containing protein [Actinophytocola oryzae]|uniref:Acyl transferase domain-containing protein n=2 Tax=Actinophytocola oryzae TaxID=502181 RepID=A0A4R7VG12_9PSEU|nr:acyl transferase domain-containing protein [Actinophytocola oryzae]
MAGENRLRDYLKRVTTDLHHTRRRLDELRARAEEPVAVVGIGCRLPGGVTGPDGLWELLSQGRDAITTVPADRGWPAGDRHWRGGFVAGVDRFDADFFGIAPREAVTMDPQQRLLLETGWEAVERAGIAPGSLSGERVGVFVGTSGQTYSELLMASAERDEGHISTGNTASVLSGRLSYALGLHGPSITVDTACSSSLVAVHLAVRSLRAGESSLALAAGVAVVSVPEVFAEFDRQGGIAADGRCKAFAAAADGTSWAEGVGVLVLARLSTARALGYPVLALVRGSAVNSDGATSGLTVPNGPAQERVIRDALADAGLTADGVDVVEAHGTGTSLGDPIEAAALAATYGRDRDEPVLLGSLKSNLGHTQAAAGVAGMIKMVLALGHARLPATLHVDVPSPHVDWPASGLALLTEATDWPRGERPRRAGVSSFGFSGTNAHVVLEEAPATDDVPEARSVAVLPWLVSARTAAGLRAQVGRLAAVPADPADVAFSLATGRTAFAHRLAATGPDPAAALREWLASGAAPGVRTGTATPAVEPVTAFLFAGQGSQRAGMGRELAARFPVFADALAGITGELGRDPLSHTVDLETTRDAQPALFAVEVGLFRLLESWGVRPDVVVGHSVGEVAAAHVAGVLSLVDACRLVVARGRLMGALPGGGAMLSVRAGADEVVPLLAEGAVVAAVNGPAATTVSGPAEAVAETERLLSAAGYRCRRLRVSHAFHSPLMDPMLDDFRRALDGVVFGEPTIPLISTVTGEPARMDSVDYWVQQVRRPVRFADAVTAASADVAVEIGPDGSLGAVVPGAVALLRRDRPEEDTAVAALAALHLRGVPVEWRALFAGTGARRVELPTYAFQRERFWPRPSEPTGVRAHEVEWVPVHDLPPGVVTGPWLVVGAPASALAGELAAAVGGEVAVLDTTDRAELATRLPATGGVLAVGDIGPAGLVALLQALGDAGSSAVLWCVTSGPEHAALWGLGTVAAVEYPRRWGGLVELAPGTDPAAVLPVLAAGTEDEVRLSATGLTARRLVHAAERPAEAPPTGTAMVLGGTGAAGRRVAAWLARSGVPRLVLVGRRETEADLAGAEVVVADARDAAALAELVTTHDVTAVYHAVRATGSGVIDTMDPAEVARSLEDVRASLAAAEAATEGRPLTRFVVLASLAGVLAGPGQGADAAAHAIAAAWVADRRERGLPATLVAWPRWAGVDETVVARMRRAGITPMDEDTALAALAAAGDRTLAVAEVDWARYTEVLPRPSALLRAMPGARSTPVPTPAQHDDLLALVRGLAAAVLGHGSASAVDPARSFQSLGFDSLTAVELRNALAADLGRELPATLVFDHPTPAALAAHLDGGRPEAPVTVRADDGDPIAIVGMACRYPGGVANADDLWRLVAEGRDAVTGFPTDRGWDLAALATSSATGEGGFLTGADRFDAAFFGISPREALAMDPQQRLLLEVTWEAVEQAGIDPSSLAGTATGVFAGSNINDYPELLRRSDADVLAHVGLGNAASVLSGRVAYLLGLEGPALTVDTACSSSLVALHLAARSLRAGESNLALASGVLVMTTPAAFVDFTTQGGLSPDGRCKAFGEGADGTGWSEGVGVLVLERLSDAVRKGHEVLAVVRGSAVNSDGASNGLTAPNGPSQQRVIRAALASAGLSGSEVDVVEAHGTGTTLGDPIEAQALLATYGQDREQPLLLGSIKSNLGHTQAAAGVAGVIKMVQAMRHGVVPPTLHAGTPTSHVDWSAGAVSLVTEPVAWPETGRVRRAGVSSFGVSGTNAHVVLEQAPEPEAVADGPAVPWVLSARTPEALREQAARLAGRGELDPAAVARSLATGRTAFTHRAAVTALDRQGRAAALTALANGEPHPELVTGTGGVPRVAVLFAGQGTQRPGMGNGLAAAHPVFAQALEEAVAALDRHLDRPLRQVLCDAELLGRTEYAQPALFAVEVALYRLVESWGVRPGLVIGHSVGEVAAAHVAGVLTLAGAAELVVARGRLMQAIPGGVMVAVEAAEAEVALGEGVDLAAVNGPSAVVLSGDEDAVLAAAARMGGKTRRLPVAHAFHSSHMDAMTDQLTRTARGVAATPPALPVVSTVTATTDADLTDPAYWGRQARATVRFADAVRTARDLGADLFLELGPDSTLAGLVDGVPVLRRDRPEPAAAATALARLHVAGVALDWAGLTAGARLADLPTYPFQGRRFWPQEAPEPDAGSDDWWTELTAGPDTAATLDVDPAALKEVLPALSAYRVGRQTSAAADSIRYRVGWTPVSSPRPGRVSGWLAVVPEGHDPRVLSGFADVTTLVVREGEDTRPALATRLAVHGDVTGVVSLLALAETGPPAMPESLTRTVALVQALGDAGVTAPLWCVTSGAVTAERGERLRAPAQAAIWGLGRGVALEHPDRWGGLVDLPATVDTETAARLAALLGNPDGEDQVALRGTTYGRRLTSAPASPAKAGTRTGSAPRSTPDSRATIEAAPGMRTDGTFLVTGGTGAVGAHFARDLVRRGVPRLVLASRRGVDAPGARALVAELTRLGAEVRVVACDTADRDATAAMLAPITDLTGVVHAAGVLDDGMLTDLTPERLHTGLAAKSVAAWHLHELTLDRPLTTFILCASIAGSIGAAAQGPYAAANSLLDALAQHRADLGLPALSVSWSPWAGAGMGVDAAVEAWMRRAGVTSLDPGRAVDAAHRANRNGDTTLTVADIDWTRYAPGLAAVRPTRLLDLIPAARPAPETTQDTVDLAGRLVDMSEPERVATLTRLVLVTSSAVLGYGDRDEIAPEQAFADLGFDSLTSVEFRNRLAAATGLDLARTVVFDYPTPAALARRLRGLLTDDTDPVQAGLDRLEKALAEHEPGDRSRVAERLRALAARWDPDPEPGGPDLLVASDDEVFEFIGKEFGIS